MTAPGTGPKRRGIDCLLRPDRVEAALWRAHAARADPESGRRLFEHYRRFAERLAAHQFARRRPGNFDRGDVQQLAYEALLQAIDRFDPGRGVPFEAYARIRINGHIGNGLAQASEAAAQYSYRQRAERDRLRSLEEGAAGLEAIPDPAPSAYETLAWNQLQARIHELLERLPEKEAFVMRQHYRNGASFQQIAALLGVTRGRVSQIHRAALQRMRSLLARYA